MEVVGSIFASLTHSENLLLCATIQFPPKLPACLYVICNFKNLVGR